MLVLVYMVKSPLICCVGALGIGYAGAGGVLQMVTVVANDLFPKIKGTLTRNVRYGVLLKNADTSK